jgi:hypothetical protein
MMDQDVATPTLVLFASAGPSTCAATSTGKQKIQSFSLRPLKWFHFISFIYVMIPAEI